MTAARPAVGIADIRLATASRVLSLDDLAAAQGVDPAKYHVGIGQDEFSVPAEDEDPVTLACAAAAPILAAHGTEGVRSLFVGSESGVDQSKSIGAHAHALLGLPTGCRAVEFKQACYGGTAALRAALGLVAAEPGERVLVVATDVAHYELGGGAEATQGAAAVAMLVSADPAVLCIEPGSGQATIDVFDFWRPNDRAAPLVDGKLSVRAYEQAVVAAWDDYAAHGGGPIGEIARFCYHQPFTRMAEKAHQRLLAHLGLPHQATAVHAALEPTERLNRRLGNSYTASVYSALLSLLTGDEDLAGRRILIGSYGSGSVAEVFTGVPVAGYREALRPAAPDAALAGRVRIGVEEYRRLHALAERGSAEDYDTAVGPGKHGPVRFAGVHGGIRRYEPVAGA